ncbi:diacylglycerol kinase family enzyme [Microbacterium endophyticum]|uniref:Diacylglycerol kinase family enzyme n=1 Tax=Microbacterium endophyticum TaxID=1526412 RepID=A0A7W4YLX3_9MICO|nr:diacylglycerol kinase family protein [Microbacterium endophyticum]MBB2975880.1 diacylglycerol kinase family enzyme [Microbacterium endophyticum]NIK36363.1 diacylglycerol kinase family enzyme [Microbacterium endophyticum]
MTADAAGHRRAALIYNPTKVDPKRVREQVTHYCAMAGWQHPLFLETTLDDIGDGLARAALAAHIDVVLVAGGDGTVRAVAHALAETGVPLTIVPSGTGNLLARNLNLPLDDPELMIRASFDGDRLAVDIGVARIERADGEMTEAGFVVMAGMGLDAAMIANTRPHLKKTVGWVAYVDGAARSLPGARPFRAMFQVGDGRLHSAKAQSILVANCGALPAGIALMPEASLRDGMLDVAVIQPSGWFGWLGVFRKIWWDNSVLRRFHAGRLVLQRRGRYSSVHFFQGGISEIGTAPPQPVEIDGDEFGLATGLRCHVLPGALIAVVPRGHDIAAL